MQIHICVLAKNLNLWLQNQIFQFFEKAGYVFLLYFRGEGSSVWIISDLNFLYILHLLAKQKFRCLTHKLALQLVPTFNDLVILFRLSSYAGVEKQQDLIEFDSVDH